jgi:hypothetical protein
MSAFGAVASGARTETKNPAGPTIAAIGNEMTLAAGAPPVMGRELGELELGQDRQDGNHQPDAQPG